MFDMSSPTTPLPWHATLEPGDLVAFRFPCSERGPREKPKVRPCLILEIRESGERRFAEVVYGTSADTTANRGLDIEVDDNAAIGAAGLDRPTRFVGARRVLVSLDHTGFDISAAGGSPIIGRLSCRARAEMEKVQTRIRADRERILERRKRPAVQRTVIVEYRPSRRGRTGLGGSITGVSADV